MLARLDAVTLPQHVPDAKSLQSISVVAAQRPTDTQRVLSYLTHSVFKGVLQKSTQIRQFILYISNSKGLVDGFVGELTSAKRLSKHCVRYNLGRRLDAGAEWLASSSTPDAPRPSHTNGGGFPGDHQRRRFPGHDRFRRCSRFCFDATRYKPYTRFLCQGGDGAARDAARQARRRRAICRAVGPQATKGPMWGYPFPVLGAISPFLEPF